MILVVKASLWLSSSCTVTECLLSRILETNNLQHMLLNV